MGTALWGQRLEPGSPPARLTGVLSRGTARIALSPDGRRIAVQPSYSSWAWVMDLVSGTLGLALLPPDSHLLPEMGRTVLRTLHEADDDRMPSFPLIAIGVTDSHTRTVARVGRTPVGTSDVLDPPTSIWYETDDGSERLHVVLGSGRADRTIALPPGAGVLVVDSGIQGIDLPGWVPVFPYGLAYLPDDQGSRLAVNPRTGRTVPLPPVAIGPANDPAAP